MAKSKSESSNEKANEKEEKGMSRMDMVRVALQELGMEARPMDIQNYIQEHYGVEVSTAIISNYKSQIRTKSEGGGTTPRRSRAKTAAEPLRVEDFEMIRSLVQRLGAEQVVRLVQVVA